MADGERKRRIFAIRAAGPRQIAGTPHLYQLGVAASMVVSKTTDLGSSPRAGAISRLKNYKLIFYKKYNIIYM